MGVVYKATNLANGKSYIGSTVDFKSRMSTYKSIIAGKTVFERDIAKFGLNGFSWEIIAEITKLLELRVRELQEIVWQDTFFPKGYNFPQQVRGNCKPVKHIETGKVYTSIAEAAHELGTSRGAVQRLCDSGGTLINTIDYFNGHLQWYED